MEAIGIVDLNIENLNTENLQNVVEIMTKKRQFYVSIYNYKKIRRKTSIPCYIFSGGILSYSRF